MSLVRMTSAYLIKWIEHNRAELYAVSVNRNFLYVFFSRNLCCRSSNRPFISLYSFFFIIFQISIQWYNCWQKKKQIFNVEKNIIFCCVSQTQTFIVIIIIIIFLINRHVYFCCFNAIAFQFIRRHKCSWMALDIANLFSTWFP